jgi:hypothetical protein
MKRKDLDAGTIERVLYLLPAFFVWAKRAGHVTVNPVADYFDGLAPSERQKLKSKHNPETRRSCTARRTWRSCSGPCLSRSKGSVPSLAVRPSRSLRTSTLVDWYNWRQPQPAI